MQLIKSVIQIDSGSEVCEILRFCFHELGHWTVAPAFSIQEGLEQLADKHPDAILLDLPKPETPNGMQLIWLLRDCSPTRSIPIILLLDANQQLSPYKMQSMGIVGTITKPFDLLKLLQVAQLLNRTTERY